MNTLRLPSCLVLSAALWACKSSQAPEDPAAEACVLAQTLAIAKASASISDSSMAVLDPGKYFRITLQPQDTTFTRNNGYVKLDVPGSGVYRVFLNADYPFGVVDSAFHGQSEIAGKAYPASCPEVRVSHDFRFQPGKYFFLFGTTDSSHVGFLVKAAGP